MSSQSTFLIEHLTSKNFSYLSVRRSSELGDKYIGKLWLMGVCLLAMTAGLILMVLTSISANITQARQVTRWGSMKAFMGAV